MIQNHIAFLVNQLLSFQDRTTSGEAHRRRKQQPRLFRFSFMFPFIAPLLIPAASLLSQVASTTVL